MPRISRAPLLISFLIVIYIMLFEWALFGADVLVPSVNVLKLLIPGVLLVLIPIRQAPSPIFRRFILFFVLFMLWSLIPSLVASEYQETVGSWLKYLPRLLFILLVGLHFLRQPEAPIRVMKILVVISVLTVIQFFILVPAMIFEVAEPFYVAGLRATHFGPYGILGNQSAMMFFSELPFPVFRLTGFWHEPSNASGFLFATFFLARLIYISEQKRLWKVLSWVCLTGGFLALSNAGYLAIAAPILFACAFMKKSGWKIAYVIVLGFLSIGLAYFALQGRSLVAEQYSGSGGLKALAGARAGTEIDPYSGRVELLEKNIEVLVRQPFGIGMRISGEGHYEDASASAPVQWLAYTGFIGLLLILLREYQVLKTAISHSSSSDLVMNASQAWLAMFTQHLAYGTWLTPAYLVLCAFVVAISYHQERVPFADHFVVKGKRSGMLILKPSPAAIRSTYPSTPAPNPVNR